jgi:type I restriction enzyme S subunit
MKEGWDYKKLGEVTSTINGLWTGKKPPFINIAVVRNTNFTKDCKLDMTNVAYLDVEEKQFSTRKLQYGDIIIEKSGGSEKQPVGRPVLFNIKEGNYSFSNFTSTLRINNKSELDPHFLHYSLLGAYFRGATSKMQAKTTGIHNLDFKAYLRLLIPIPTIEEQQQIVSELDLLS